LTRDEQTFVDELLAGLDAWPAYYTHMAPANAAGPSVPDLSTPERADAEQIRKRLADGEWVVDLRNRVAFAARHVAGTLNFGLDGSFATYLGWLIPWGTPVTLLGETEQQVADAQRELVRIGIDRPAAYATGTPSDWTEPGELSTTPRATFADLVQVRHHRQVVVLDVRRGLEWAQSHLDGALHIPLHELLRRVDEVPDGEVWVHCAAGYRASIAASILAAVRRRVVAVDDDFDQARADGQLRSVLASAGTP
jgi:rhodanese-related sulfurtransferase